MTVWAGIIGSVLVGAMTLVGVIYTANSNADKMQSKLELHQAVSDEKIDNLTREVRAHNDFAKRIPVMEEQIKAIGRRVDKLEQR